MMTTLSRDAADTLRPFAPHAVTDVTGFGLLGHAHEVAERSGVRLVLDADRLPVLPGALEAAAAGVRTGGDTRNRDFAASHVDTGEVAEDLVAVAYDPQTSGGLLIALPEEKAAVLAAAFTARDLFLPGIGRVEAGAGVVLA